MGRLEEWGVQVIVGVGVDVVEVDRLRRMRPAVFGRFMRRVLADGEVEYCLSRRDPYQCVAARFAAKEAFVKALGLGDAWSVGFREVWVLGRPPRLSAVGRALERLRELGVSRVHVSLSHTRGVAVAVVVLEGGGDDILGR